MAVSQGEPKQWVGSLSVFVLKKDVADLKQKVTQSKTHYNDGVFSWLALEAKGLKCHRSDVPLKVLCKHSPYTRLQEVPSIIYTIFSFFTSTV